MKTLYVPQGTVMRHESVDAERIVVKGTLLVDSDIRARQICGNGTIAATKITARDIKVGVLEADEIVTKKSLPTKSFVTGCTRQPASSRGTTSRPTRCGRTASP